MPFLIPNDWDEITYADYVVNWPLSPMWQSLLAGGITAFSNPHIWDAASGDVEDVLEVVADIIETNSETGLLPAMYIPINPPITIQASMEPIIADAWQNLSASTELFISDCPGYTTPSLSFSIEMLFFGLIDNKGPNQYHLKLSDINSGFVLAQSFFHLFATQITYVNWALKQSYESQFIYETTNLVVSIETPGINNRVYTYDASTLRPFVTAQYYINDEFVEFR